MEDPQADGDAMVIDAEHSPSNNTTLASHGHAGNAVKDVKMGSVAGADSPSPSTVAQPSDPTPSSSSPAREVQPKEEDDDQDNDEEEEKCPACKSVSRRKSQGRKLKESWVACEGCQTWFHWDCVGKGGDLAAIDKWYCSGCIAKNGKLTITFKPPARKSSRRRTQPNYVAMDSHNTNGGAPSSSSETSAAPKNKWIQIVRHKPMAADKFKRMKGQDVTLEWLKHDEDAFKEPIVIEDPEGLGMDMPGWKEGEKFGVDDVTALVGGDTPVEVIDTISQSTSPGWTLSRWSEYFNTPVSEREKIRNVISLEVSGTPLGDKVVPPKLVKEIDWVEMAWPANKRGKGQYPKVQLYCLMSVAECWTDMHVDFAGSSVFYHVLNGSKVFYFIRPTKANLNAYEKWCGSEIQDRTWLGDLVDEVVKVELKEGNTMFIPTGWIHAVYTPVDSLVFGGNFLHSYNIATQLRVREIEINTKVPKKFRFPFFQKLCWYIAEKYNRDLKAKEEFSPRVLEGLRALADFLVSEARSLEGRGNTSESSRRDIRDQVPGDKVKDASALAREFRWRAKLLLDGESGEEITKTKSTDKSRTGTPVAGKNGKRRRVTTRGSSQDDEEPMLEEVPKRPRREGMFKNFEPKEWDVVRISDSAASDAMVSTQSHVKRPDNWEVREGQDVEGTLEKEQFEVVRMRKLDNGGYEREKVIRIRETWKPSE